MVENIIQTVKHQHSAPALVPPQYNLNNLRREKKEPPQGSAGAAVCSVTTETTRLAENLRKTPTAESRGFLLEEPGSKRLHYSTNI